MKLNKACPLRLFLKSRLWSSFISAGFSAVEFIVILHMCDCFLAGTLHSALALGPSHTAKPLFNSAHEYLIHTVLSNPPLDKDPIQVVKQRGEVGGGGVRAGATQERDRVHTRMQLLCRINHFTCVSFLQKNVCNTKGQWGLRVVERKIFYPFEDIPYCKFWRDELLKQTDSSTVEFLLLPPAKRFKKTFLKFI